MRSRFIRATVAALACATLLVPSRGLAVSLLSASSSARLAQIERQTEGIRGLAPRRQVRAVFASSSTFNADLRREVRRDTSDRDIAIGARELRLLGWITPTQNYRKIVFQGITAQVVGFYDPPTKTLYMRSNNRSALGLRRDVIAHEYTHALQDQYYNLDRLIPNVDTVKVRNSDRDEAVHALTEGDATITQILFVRKEYSSAEYKRWLKTQQGPQNTPPLPKAIEKGFMFPYNQGVTFAVSLWKRGGMKAINAAYRQLPDSTYDILHPEAYAAGWKPTPVTIRGVVGFSDWKQVDDDVFGALNYQILLTQSLKPAQATAVTSRYRGDRYVFLERGSQDAALFRSVWTNARAANDAKLALISALRHRYRSATVYGGPIVSVHERNGAVAFRVQGARLDMAYGPTAKIAAALVTAPTR